MGGGEVEAASIDVGVFVIETVGGGAGDGAVDDVGEEAFGGGGVGDFGVGLFEYGQFVAVEGDFGVVGEADLVLGVGRGGGVGDKADAAGGAGQHLGACGNDQVKLGGHIYILIAHYVRETF